MSTEYDLFMAKLFSQADKSFIPLSGAFELTPRCPLDCKMCYIHRRENDREALSLEKSTEWWLGIAEEAKNAGLLIALLTGGEPLLRPDFREIYLGMRKMGLILSVNTNGVLIDSDTVRFFKEHPPKVINISLYGASEETYEALCGSGEAFKKALNAIVSLHNAGVKVKINLTANGYNRQDVEKIYALANELKIPVQPVSYMFPPVRVGGEADRLPPEEAAEVQFQCRKLSMGEERLKILSQNSQNDITGAPPGDCTDENGERIPCRAGLSSFWITWDGKMTPCGMMNTPSAELSSFREAWEKMNKEREKIILPAKCKNCNLREYCDMCAAVAYAENGSFGETPVYSCRKAAHYKKLCDEFNTG